MAINDNRGERLKPYAIRDGNDPRLLRAGRKPGSKNRKTILRKWIELETVEENPLTGENEKLSVEDQVMLSLIRVAKKGDVRAIQEIQDTLYGKIVNKVEAEITVVADQYAEMARKYAAQIGCPANEFWSSYLEQIRENGTVVTAEVADGVTRLLLTDGQTD